MSSKSPQVKHFKGLNNVSDPLRLGLEWLAKADNVDIFDTGAIAKRAGYILARAGNFTGGYSTADFSRSYFVVGGVIQTFEGVPIYTCISAAPMYWAEVNGQVFFNNGPDTGIILPDNTVLPWAWTAPLAPVLSANTGTLPAGQYQVRCTFVLDDGRETGAGDSATITLPINSALGISDIPQGGARTNVYVAPANSEVFQLLGSFTSTAITWSASPDTLGQDQRDAFSDPLPLGCSAIAIWKGRAYAAQYMPEVDQTVVWYSEAMGFHLFDARGSFFMLPGHVLMLAAHPDALIIGTDTRIHAYDGTQLAQLVDYGVVPGQHWAWDKGSIFFWSKRGLCKALPFTNLTENHVSVAPGVQAGGTIVCSGGQKRYLVALHSGGAPFNQFQ